MNSGQSTHHRAVICRFQTSRQLLYIVSLVDSWVMELALGSVLFDTVIGGGWRGGGDNVLNGIGLFIWQAFEIQIGP